MNQNNEPIRDASVLGIPKMLLLGLQHMFAMFGATILVPILVNSYFGEDVLHVQVTLICAGIGTLFFHFCTKFKVPAKKKRNIDPALGKRNMILHQNMDCLLTGLLIRCSA